MLTIYKNYQSRLDASSFDADDYPMLQRFADDAGCEAMVVCDGGRYVVVLETYDDLSPTPVDLADMRWLPDNVESLADGSVRFGRIFHYSMSLYVDVDDITEENVDELVELASYEWRTEPFSYDALSEVESEELDRSTQWTIERLRAHDYDVEKFENALSNSEIWYEDEWPGYAEEDVKEALIAAGAKFD